MPTWSDRRTVDSYSIAFCAAQAEAPKTALVFEGTGGDCRNAQIRWSNFQKTLANSPGHALHQHWLKWETRTRIVPTAGGTFVLRVRFVKASRFEFTEALGKALIEGRDSLSKTFK